MALSGHSKELSLADLIQANLLGRNTCRIMVSAPQGRGVIYVDAGELVDAHFVDLAGEPAFYALVTQDDVFFQVDTGVLAPSRTIFAKWERLMLQAMRLKDEGRLPVPRPPVLVPEEPSRTPAEPAVAPVPAPGVAGVDDPSREQGAQPQRQNLVLIALGSLVLVAAVAAVVATAPGQRTRPLRGQAAAAPTVAPIEDLDQPGDVLPQLLDGAAPRSPDPTSVVTPTVVCRILVDERGAVLSARVYRPRSDIEPFEKAALAAVKSYRFRPGTRAGRPVPVWLDLPVSFQ